MVSGSAPLPAEVLQEWNRRVPSVEIVEGYGCSETAALASTTPLGKARPGSVGMAAPGAEMRIEAATAPTRRRAPTARSACRRPALMTGYWHDPEATAHAPSATAGSTPATSATSTTTATCSSSTG